MATKLVEAKNLIVKYLDSNCERRIITTAVTMPEIVSIILFRLSDEDKIHFYHKDVALQGDAMDNKMSETDRSKTMQKLFLIIDFKFSAKNFELRSARTTFIIEPLSINCVHT